MIPPLATRSGAFRIRACRPRTVRVQGAVALRAALALWVACLCGLAPADAQSSGRSLRRIERWAESEREPLDRVDIEELTEALDHGLHHPKTDRERFDVALLRLLGRTALESPTPHAQIVAEMSLDTAGERLRGVGGADFGGWAFRRILTGKLPSDVRMRVGACLVLDEHPKDIGLEPLLQALKDPAFEVQRAALLALTGWADADASRALLGAAQAEKGELKRIARWQLGVHLRDLERRAGRPPTAEHGWPESLGGLLAGALLPELLSPEWRRALQAAELSRYGRPEQVAPRLIEALLLWDQRRDVDGDPGAFVGVDRVRWAITDSLRAISGTAIPPDPRRWRSWWNAVRDGRREFVEDAEVSGVGRTEAGFFGLQIRSGAVAFLIDASGSMSGLMPARAHESTTDGLRNQTRFEAATDQLEKFLVGAEPGTVFRLALFSTGAQVYNIQPARTDERGRDAAMRWMHKQRPDGGTQLSSGMDKLVKRDADDRVDLESLGFDTLVVLCDGATAEGRAWARSWLRSYNSEAQLVIHAVQIGSGAAHALETLAEGSGGQFVRIE
jgi:hypothetical protein